MTGTQGRVLVVVSCGVLALSLAYAFLNWVLFADTLTRRFLFGA